MSGLDSFYSGKPNRVSAAAERVQERIAERLSDPVAADEFEASMDVSLEEHFRFQQLQTEAHVSGTLSQDEALTVYAALGEVGSPSNGGWAASTPLALKVAVTMLMGQLLERRVRS